MAKRGWVGVAAVSAAAAMVLGGCGGSSLVAPSKGVINSALRSKAALTCSDSTVAIDAYSSTTDDGTNSFSSATLAVDRTRGVLVVSFVAPAAKVRTGVVPGALNDRAASQYESAGLNGTIGDGPRLELASTSGEWLYEVVFAYPGQASVNAMDEQLNSGNPKSWAAYQKVLDGGTVYYAPEYSDGRRVSVEIPLSKIRRLGSSFLWQFTADTGSTTEVCPASPNPQPLGDLVASEGAAGEEISPSSFTAVIMGDFGRYPPLPTNPTGTTATAPTTGGQNLAAPTSTTPTTSATTVPACTGQLVVKVTGSTGSGGNAALQGTVTNTTNVSVDLSALVLNETYPASSSSWNAQEARADVDNQFGAIAPGATETWSIYEPTQDGNPITPTVDVVRNMSSRVRQLLMRI